MLQPIRIEEVKEIYKGKANTCACGCAGTYFTEEHPQMLAKLLKKFNSLLAGAEVCSSNCFMIEYGKQMIVVHTKETK